MSDVVIAGAGPAGLGCALALRRLGLDVGVFEQRRLADRALDKVCGEGLMPDAVASLEQLGVGRASLGGRPFRGIRYLDACSSVEGHFPGAPGLGVRRTTLHRALVEHAEAQGVALEWGRAIEGLRQDPGSGDYWLESGGETLRPRIVVAADGLRSRLRRAAGLERRSRESAPRFGIRRHFEVEPWTDLVEVYWSEGAEAYVTPLSDRLVGVAILWRPADQVAQRSDSSRRFEILLSRFPALAERLPSHAASTPARGLGPLRQTAVTRARGNLFLVGDAGGYRDAITGEGMALAFAQANALAAALSHGSVREAARRYASGTRRHDRLPGALTELVLLLARRPQLRRRALSALSRQPRFFDRLLAVHAREMPVRRLGLGSTLRFGTELLRSR